MEFLLFLSQQYLLCHFGDGALDVPQCHPQFPFESFHGEYFLLPNRNGSPHKVGIVLNPLRRGSRVRVAVPTSPLSL